MATPAPTTQRPTKPKRPLWRRIVRIVAWFVTVVIVLAGIALALLHTGWGKDFVRGRIEARLATKLKGSVSLGSLDYGFLFSHIELGDVVVRDAQGTTVLAVKRIETVVDRGSLLDGTPIVERLALHGVVVTVVESPDGKSNLSGLVVPSSGQPLAALTVKQLTVDGTVSIAKRDGTLITIKDFAVTGTISARPRDQELAVELGPTTATVSVVRAHSPARVLPVSLGSVRLARSGASTDVTITELAVAAASAAAVKAHLEIVDGQPRGVQSIAIDKLHVDHEKLYSLLGRKLLVHDVDADIKLAGPIDALVVHGAVATGSTTLGLDGKVNLADRLRPSYDLAFIGKGKTEDLLVAPRPQLPSIATDIAIHLTGAGITLTTADATATVVVGPTVIGELAVDGLDAKVSANHGAVTLEHMRATGLGFEVGASGTLAADTTLVGRLTVAGDPDDAIKVLHTAGIATPAKLPPLPRIDLAINAKGSLDGEIELEIDPMHLPIAGGTVAITGGAVIASRKLVGATTRLVLRDLDLAKLARLAGRPPKVLGTLDGTVSIRRTGTARTAEYDLAVHLPTMTIHAKGNSDGTSLTTTALLAQNGVELGAVTAKIPLDAHGIVPTRAWRVTADLPERPIAQLAELLPPALRAKLPPGDLGTARVRADLRGTPAQPRGTVDLVVDGPRSATIHAQLAPGAAGAVVATTSGTVEASGITAQVAGTVTIPRLFAGRKVAVGKPIVLDQTIDIAEQPIGSFPKIPPKVAALGGTLGGRVHVTGALPDVKLDGTVAWRGYAMADGSTGETDVAITGSPTVFTATVTHAKGALTIVADVTRKPDRIDVKARAKADDTPLWPLLPAVLAGFDPGARGADLGRLRWDMTADLGLAKTATGMKLDRASVQGTLDVTGGSLAIPHSTRRWHDIELELTGDPQGIRLGRLELHESDRQLPDRTLKASGLVTLEGTRPQKLDLVLETTDWLLLGLTSPLFGDAPTAAIDARAHVEADLAQGLHAVDVTVEALTMKNPDRHDRAHQPERPSVSGDIIYVDAEHPAGKLPVAAVKPKRVLRPVDIRIHIPQPVHIVRWPLDVMAKGEAVISLGPDGIVPHGEIEFVSGVLNLFAQDHQLVRGTATITPEHPTGWLDLDFERKLPAENARDLANPDVGVRLHLSGSPSKPQVGISGAAATLPEVFTTYNAGRSVYAPRPGLPATSTVQVPRGDQSNVLVFVSLAAPHLLFLDRISAWADATEPRGAYGRIRNLEADRYFSDDHNRVRTVGRPSVPGRSTAEVQLDRMLVRSARAALGIGVRAGDRLGGGVGLIFEWSSSD